MNILEHLDKNKLHHAYLIEGDREKVLAQILKFLESSEFKTAGNPDFYNFSMDSFKIDDAFYLRTLSQEKSFSYGKKVFILSANSMTIDAQNVLLKMFEEPISETHFMVITPDANSLLKTLVSRFYLIKAAEMGEGVKEADQFIAMNFRERIEYLKDLLVETEDEDGEGNKIIPKDGARSNALRFLNSLESVLHERFKKRQEGISAFEHIFKVREFLRMPGSSVKNLMESVALKTPNF